MNKGRIAAAAALILLLCSAAGFFFWLRASLSQLDARYAAIDGRLLRLESELTSQRSFFAENLDSRMSRTESRIRADSRRIVPKISSISNGVESMKADIGGISALLGSSSASSDSGMPAPAAASVPAAGTDTVLRIRAEKEAADAFSSGHFEAAVKDYGLLCESWPGNSAYHYRHALSLYRINPSDSRTQAQVMAELKGLPEADQDSAGPLELLGLIYADRQDWPPALACFARLCEKKPDDASVFREAAECAFYSGDSALAAGYIERAAALKPGDADTASLAAAIAASNPPKKEEP